jgi:anti-repressor protein
VAKDVCDALGLENGRRAVQRLDADEKAAVTQSDGRQRRRMNVVTEPGLYKLIFRSDKPEAKAFFRWVAHEVLPQIRCTGSYVAEVAPRPVAGGLERSKSFPRSFPQYVLRHGGE